MWSSSPITLIALLLLSDPATARRHRRSAAIEACTSPSPASPDGHENFLERQGVATAPAALFSNSFPAVPLATVIPTALPAIAFTTFTVVPMPMGTVDGVVYSGVPMKTETTVAEPTASTVSAGIFLSGSPLGTGIPSGVFWSGYGSGTGTGSSSPRPTGFIGQNNTSNRTHHHSVRPRPVTLTPTSIPFFSLIEPSSTPTTPIVKVQPSTFAAMLPTTSVSTSSISTSNIIISSFAVSPIIKALPTLDPTLALSLPAPSLPTPAPASKKIPFLRGVNLGGWLVLEKWMNPDAFTGAFSSAVDQYTFDSLPGASSALRAHWDTFFTEADIKTIATTGINALRIPIGYWAYDNANTPYITGADAYLEKAIAWARDNGMYVWVDCHGSPGSQNGFDNSGHAGSVDWQTKENLERSIAVLKIMAKKYGAQKYADVVVGLELTNEPISYGNNKFSITQQWAADAYAAVKSQVENQDLVIVMHDAFQGAGAWTDIASSLNGRGKKTFGVDTHLYQLFTDADNALTQAQHITTACGWADELAAADKVIPTYVGEWSAATNVCVNPDGSTTAGTSCTVDGCQCQSVPFDDWNQGMVEQVRRFVEAQLDVFESSSSGYFMWSAKGPGGWGFLNGIANGAIPLPVTSRKYPRQCGGGKVRREGRGMLGVGGEAY